MSNEGKKPIKIEKGKRSIKISKALPNKLSVLNIKKLIVLILIVFVVIFSIKFISYLFVPNIESIKNSVVMIEIYDEEGELTATGSGFSAYEKDWIITNFHVIEGASSILVITDEKKEYAVTDIVIFNKKEDLAIVKIDGNLNNLELGNGNKVKTKDKVTAIGSPMGEKNTISEGIISNTDEEDVIRITTPISHGSSGGVLLNDKNQVIGITSAGYDDAQNLNFAINVNVLKEMYKVYKNKDFDNIEWDFSERCMSSNVDDAGFDTCVGAINDYYSTDSIDTFYRITNPISLYDYDLSNGTWGYLYKDLSEDDKKLSAMYYQELLNKSYCSTKCNISSSINSWSTDEFFINLKVLEKDLLAFVVVDLDNYKSDDDKFDRVEEYPLEAAQKSLILYLIGNRRWNNIHKDNKEDIFNYFDSKYETKDLGAILELLGYDVQYNSDGTLTAWW